jgi:chromosome segregation protein
MRTEEIKYETQLSEVNTQIYQLSESSISLLNKVNVSRNELEQAIQYARGLKENFRKGELAKESIQKNLAWYDQQKIKLEDEQKLDQESEIELSNEIESYNSSIIEAKEKSNLLNHHLDETGLEEVQTQLSYWLTRLAVTEQAVNDATRRSQERIVEILKLQHDQELLQNRQENIKDELVNVNGELGQLKVNDQLIAEEISTLRSKIEPVEMDVNNLEIGQNNLLSLDTDARLHFRNSEHAHSQAKISMVRRQDAIDSLRRRVEDDFGLVSFDYAESVSGPKPLPLTGMVEELPYIRDLSLESDEIIQRLRTQIKRMGPINIEAQIEFNEVKERFEFITEQISDLNKAESDIQVVIAELDVLMQREFRRTFDAVAQEFKLIFSRLFDGGNARLELTDPENITDTGIDIEARLPGRRDQGLSLLSGGERSLTAVALVFALLKISPTPFCILDEVDAMLDDSNVGRFREMLTELSSNIQFIVITHNRNTVQAASVIYGITMGRDSASKVIGLKLDEVSEEYGV